MRGMAAAAKLRRTGAVTAIVLAGVGTVITLMILAGAVLLAVMLAVDNELDNGTAWTMVLALALYGAISAAATVYIGRRGLRVLRSTTA